MHVILLAALGGCITYLIEIFCLRLNITFIHINCKIFQPSNQSSNLQTFQHSYLHIINKPKTFPPSYLKQFYTMASSPQFVVKAHFNGETYMCPTVGFLFRNTDNVRFLLNGKANFSYFKKRLEAKLERGPVSQIFYQSPVFFGNNQVIFYKVEVQDDEDFQNTGSYTHLTLPTILRG